MKTTELIKQIENNYKVSNKYNDLEKALQLEILNNAVDVIEVYKVLELLNLEKNGANFSTVDTMLKYNIDLFWDFINKFAVSGVHGFLYDYMKYYYTVKQNEGSLKEINNELIEVIKNVSKVKNLDFNFLLNTILVTGISATLNDVFLGKELNEIISRLFN